MNVLGQRVVLGRLWAVLAETWICFSSRRVPTLQQVKLSKSDFRLTENVRYFLPQKSNIWAKLAKRGEMYILAEICTFWANEPFSAVYGPFWLKLEYVLVLDVIQLSSRSNCQNRIFFLPRMSVTFDPKSQIFGFLPIFAHFCLFLTLDWPF